MREEGTLRREVRRKLSGRTPLPPRDLPEDLIQHKLASVVVAEENGGVPRVQFDKVVLEKLSLPWKEALVIKLLGRTLNYHVMKDKLKNLWRLKAGYDVMFVGYGYFLVKFDLEEDREKVIVGGPWMILDHYLAVK